MLTAMTTAPVLLPPTADLFKRAAEHAQTALGGTLGDHHHRQFTHAIELLDHTDVADPDHMADLAAMAWEVLHMPYRPATAGQRVQNAAKALWETDYPPGNGYMPWEEAEPNLTAHHVKLAEAALVADEAEHQRLFEAARDWHDAWQAVDEDRPEIPNPAILRALTSWLVDHNIGICDEPDGEDGGLVYNDAQAMTELAAWLLVRAPGMRPATEDPTGPFHGFQQPTSTAVSQAGTNDMQPGAIVRVSYETTVRSNGLFMGHGAIRLNPEMRNPTVTVIQQADTGEAKSDD